MAKVVMFGNGIFAEVVYAYLKYDSPHEVVACTIDREFMTEPCFMDLPIVPFEEVESQYPPSEYKMFVALGYQQMNKLRARKCAEAKEKGYELISYVSSKALTWPDLDLGENCFIMEENVIQPYTHIGDGVIMWSGNHLGHHSTIQSYCFVASHAVIAGGVTIEPFCFIGINATIRDQLTIARESVIGAGAVMLKNSKERGVYVGQQATLLPRTSDQLKRL